MEGREWIDVRFDGRHGMIACASGWKDVAHCVLGADAEDCTERQFAKAVTAFAQSYTFTFSVESGRTSPSCPQWIAQGRTTAAGADSD